VFTSKKYFLIFHLALYYLVVFLFIKKKFKANSVKIIIFVCVRNFEIKGFLVFKQGCFNFNFLSNCYNVCLLDKAMIVCINTSVLE